MNKTIMHINYAEIRGWQIGNKTIDDICRMAAEIGFDGIEFRGTLPRELEHLSLREYMEQIAAGKKKYGLTNINFGMIAWQSANPDKDARMADIAQAVETVKLANELCGTELINSSAAIIKSPISTAPDKAYEYHGSAAATEEQWKLTVDTFQQIGREIEKIGVRYAFETHMNFIHDKPEVVRKFIDEIASPVIGINMDYGNTIYFPNRPSPEEAIDIYGDKLFYVHLKNSIAIPGSISRIPCPLSDGEINHRSYLAKLKDVGFTGPIGIEAPRPGDRRYFAEQDFAYLKSVMNAI